MRATVDPEKCQGHARCVLSAPRIFDLDEATGHAVVDLDELPGDLGEAARSAAEECPEGAISVLE
jgi:ferredoxin